jgi:hypothetical protein
LGKGSIKNNNEGNMKNREGKGNTDLWLELKRNLDFLDFFVLCIISSVGGWRGWKKREDGIGDFE